MSKLTDVYFADTHHDLFMNKNKDEIGKKNDHAKPRWSLVPEGVMNEVIAVLEHGAAKYDVDNWQHVENGRVRYYDAAMRHIDDWYQGAEEDYESGLPHLAHAICNLMFLLSGKVKK